MSVAIDPAAEAVRPGSSWAAFRSRGFALYWLGRLLAAFSVQVVSVAVAWQVYDLTRNPLDLGIVGLLQFLPSLALVLVTGHAADRFNRRRIMAVCILGEAVCTSALLALTIAQSTRAWPIFLVLVWFGIARAFIGPAMQSLVPNLVPPQDLANAIAWNSATWQLATIAGPVAGGLLYGISPETAYGTAIALFAGATLCIALVPRPPQKTSPRASWEAIVAGFRYIAGKKIILGAISLDLFAVLLGGATALLPVYARDILEVGPWGLGLLRAGPGVGALLMGTCLILRPIKDNAGVVMFLAVAAFGLFTVVFGASTTVWLSILALVAMGAADMVSVFIRETLIQVATPDDVRGRVNAVNMVFVGASNEVGEFRAGVSAALVGVVPAVVVGGIGTVLVASLWPVLFPELRRARRLVLDEGPPPIRAEVKL